MLVRIVAGDATEPLVIVQVTAAIEHSIRLKADVVDAAMVRHLRDLIEALMAGPAKLMHQVERIQSTGIENLRGRWFPG
jgi:hypothetical protein